MKFYHRPESIFYILCPADLDMKNHVTLIRNSSCFQHYMFCEFIRLLASLLSFQGQILGCSGLHSIQTNNRLIPEGVAGWSQRYLWCRFGMALWCCLGAAREQVVASWALLSSS